MAESRFIAIFSSSQTEILTISRTLSPTVVIHPCGAVLVSVPASYQEEALARLTDSTIGSGKIAYAVASTRTTAILAARARPGSRVPPGQEAAFLAPLPVRLLQMDETSLSARTLQTLERWGIHTLGELAELPQQELVSRLGQSGFGLQQLALGKDIQFLAPIQEEIQFQGSRELEWEVDGLEPLSFALMDVLEHLCKRLREYGLATDQLQIVFRLTDGSSYRRTAPLAFPMRDPKTLVSLLRLKLQADPPRTAIRRVFIEARPVPPRTFQHSLLEPSAPNPEDMLRTRARLTTLMGETEWGTPVITDSHQPDAVDVADQDRFWGDRFAQTPAQTCVPWPGNNTSLILRRVRPPQPTSIRTNQILACSGPWKTSGQWWRSNGSAQKPDDRQMSWWREEWDVQFLDGTLCRVYWDGLHKEWFLDGFYD